MISAYRPAVESLEARALWAVLGMPAGSVAPRAASLVASLAVTRVGTNDLLTLTETNSGGQDVNVTIGCGVTDFWATEGGIEVWRLSRDGPQPLCPISLGGVLHPSQSRSFTATWDGHFNESPPPSPAGPIELHASVDGLTADAPAPVPLPPAANPAVVLTTDRAVYQAGQPVIMTVTETNNGSQPISIEYGPSIDGFFVTQNGVEVWRSNLGPQPLSRALFIGLETLQPGQSFSQSATWNGQANEGPQASEMLTGDFQVHSEVSGSNTVAIEILPAQSSTPTPLVVSLTTDRASYRAGQPVHITLFETNTTAAAIAVSASGASSVSITRQGVAVWKKPARGAGAHASILLNPGQSRQITLAWPGQFNQHPATHRTGLFLITATVDRVAASATIRIDR
jgi:hypothetical protein